MPNKFISNDELKKLLSFATNDERLALTKIIAGEAVQNPYEPLELQKEISLFGGNALANFFRNSGTGYIDIIDDVAGALEINGRPSYESELMYYDEIFYIKNEGNKNSSSAKFYRKEATELGNKYIEEYEQKIIIKVMENAYKQMKKEKEKVENNLEKIKKNENILKKDLQNKSKNLDSIIKDLNSKKFIFLNANNPEETEKLKKERKQLETKIEYINKEINDLPKKIKEQEKKLKEAKENLDNFNSNLSKTVNQYSSSSVGVITGTAGLITLANLGGFATYTFLTSFMSTVSFGTLGFGAYTAATSFLSVVIGPIGWAGLGLFTLFTLGKADMSKLVLVVATIGAIRQRIKYKEKT